MAILVIMRRMMMVVSMMRIWLMGNIRRIAQGFLFSPFSHPTNALSACQRINLTNHWNLLKERKPCEKVRIMCTAKRRDVLVCTSLMIWSAYHQLSTISRLEHRIFGHNESSPLMFFNSFWESKQWSQKSIDRKKHDSQQLQRLINFRQTNKDPC